MTGKFGLKFKLAVIAVGGILSLSAGKAFANCDAFMEEFETTSLGISYKKDPETGAIRAFLMSGEANFLAPKSSLVRKAKDWGLVNLVCAADDLQTCALETARKIAANGPVAVRQAKQAISRGMQMSLSDGLAFEIEAYNRTIPTEDRREGVAAFNERRPPNFSGE